MCDFKYAQLRTKNNIVFHPVNAFPTDEYGVYNPVFLVLIFVNSN